MAAWRYFKTVKRIVTCLLIIQENFNPDSNYTLMLLTNFIDDFNTKIDEEIKSKSEMSFLDD